MTYNKLLPFIKFVGGLLGQRYGFQLVLSTVDVIAMVANLVQEAMAVGKCGAIIMLDVNERL